MVDDRIAPLLDAVLAIARDVDLDGVLQRVVRAGRDLVGARYAALGVLDDSGTELRRFLHDGLDEATAARIGPLPTGRGVLGELIRHPHPLLLDDLTQHPAAVGFPPDHPPMHGFLGVPIVVGEEVFGNLYLTDKPDGFDESDRRLVVGLAAVAGAAIRNARDVEQLAARARVDAAVADVSTAVLSGAGVEECLQQARRAAASLADVPTAAAEVHRGSPGTPGELAQDATHLRVRVDSEGADVRLPARAVTTSDDLTAFGRRVAIAVGYARAREQVEQLAVRADRERIARDLHDTVIQRLFGAGLQLDGLTRTLGDDEAARASVETVIEELDAAIGDLRATITAMQDPGPAPLSDRLRAVVVALQPVTTGLRSLEIDGRPDQLPDDMGRDLVAVLREGITNATRHAAATEIRPRLAITVEQVELTIDDDGTGPPSTATSSSAGDGLGLGNLRERARRHGGACELVAGALGGACLRWVAPLP